MPDQDPTRQYIECITAEALALQHADLSAEEIAETAVSRCERLATASAQAFVNDMPEDEIETWHSLGRTSEMILDRQKEIGRRAGYQMALGILEEDNNQRKP